MNSYLLALLLCTGAALLIVRKSSAATPQIIVPSMAAKRPQLDVETLLRAIRWVENAQRYQKGAAGEQGYWQITRAVWIQYSGEPFACTERYADAKACDEVRRVCREHALWILQRMKSLKMPQTAESFGLLWSAGFGRVSRGQASRSKLEYSIRVQNVYDVLVTKGGLNE